MEEKKNPDEPKIGKQVAPPQEIILGVYMHCEGCAEKIRRCLKGFVGVEDVQTDCKTHKVVVRGEKADPLKVLDRVQKKSHGQVQLLSPIPKPPSVDEPEEKKTPIAQEPKLTQEITVILKVHMHCEACGQGIKRRILKMKGVVKVDADMRSSEVTVIGTFDPPKLLEYVYKRAGKQAVIVKQEEIEKAAPEEEKKGEVVAPPEGKGEKEKEKVVEVKKNEIYSYTNMNFQIYPQRFGMEMYGPNQGYAPQMFSDENPNACSVM